MQHIEHNENASSFFPGKKGSGGGGRALGRMRQGWHMCEVCSTMLVYLVGKGQCVHKKKYAGDGYIFTVFSVVHRIICMRKGIIQYSVHLYIFVHCEYNNSKEY
jgi:hypothetical protein